MEYPEWRRVSFDFELLVLFQRQSVKIKPICLLHLKERSSQSRVKAARPRWKGTDVQESLCPLLWKTWLVIRKRRALLAHLVFERLSSSLEHAIKTEEDEKKRGQSRPARNEPSRHRAELKLPRKSTGSRKTGLGWKVGVPSYWSTFALPGISLSPAKKDAIWKSWGWRGSGSKAVKRFCLHLKKEEKEDVESINLVVTDWSTSRSLLPAFAKRLRPRESIPPPFLPTS